METTTHHGEQAMTTQSIDIRPLFTSRLTADFISIDAAIRAYELASIIDAAMDELDLTLAIDAAFKAVTHA
jgi:hypothetical protein